jgi:competence protein ComGC
MWYDTLIAIVIISVLLLIVISRITKQTIPEFIGQMIDLIKEKKEEGLEHIEVYG